MSRSLVLCAAMALLASVAACGEKPQGLGGVKQDTAAYTGTGAAFAEKNWKQGDKTSWEQQLRARSQNQNDYVKTN